MTEDTQGTAKRARKATNLSQRAFAELIGVSHVTVARWETGHAPSGSASALLRVIERYPQIVVEILRTEKLDEQSPKPAAD